MNATLETVFDDAVRVESEAARLEFPYSESLARRIGAQIRRRRAARGAALVAVVLPLAGAVALGFGRFWAVASLEPAFSPSVTATSTPTPAPTPTPTPTPTASPSPTPDPAPPVTPSQTAITTTTTTTTAAPPPSVPAPDAVTGLVAYPGGGSGEIAVRWEGSPGATGYRIYRASTAGGSTVLAVTYTVATGATTITYPGSYEFFQVWSPSANTYEYVDSVDGHPAYFYVAAFNATGQGPSRGPVCAVPPGSPDSC